MGQKLRNNTFNTLVQQKFRFTRYIKGQTKIKTFSKKWKVFRRMSLRNKRFMLKSAFKITNLNHLKQGVDVLGSTAVKKMPEIHEENFFYISRYLKQETIEQGNRINKVIFRRARNKLYTLPNHIWKFKKGSKKKPTRYFYKTNADIFSAPWWVQKKIRRKVFLSKELLKSLISHNKKKVTLVIKNLFYKKMFYNPFFFKFWPVFKRQSVPYSQFLNKKTQKLWKENLSMVNKPHARRKFTSIRHSLRLRVPKIFFFWIKRLINIRYKVTLARTLGISYRFRAKKRKHFVTNINFKTPIKINRHQNFKNSQSKRLRQRKKYRNKAYHFQQKFNRLNSQLRSKNKRKLTKFTLPRADQELFWFFKKSDFSPVSIKDRFNKEIEWPHLQRSLSQRNIFTKEYEVFTKFSEGLFHQPSFKKPVCLRLDFGVKCTLPPLAILQLAFSQLNWFEDVYKFIEIVKILTNPENTLLPQKFYKGFVKKNPYIFFGHKKHWGYWSHHFRKIVPLKYKCDRKRYQFRSKRDLSLKKKYKIEFLAKSISDFYDKKYQQKQARNQPYKAKHYNNKKDFYRRKNNRKKQRKYYYKNRPYPIVNRWSFLSKRFLWSRLQKNKNLPIYHKNDLPFIKNFILTQKYLPNNVPLSESGVVLGKQHWIVHTNEWSYESNLLPRKFGRKSQELSIDLIYHNQQQISYLLYRNWSRKILHHFISYKHAHKRQVWVLTDWLMDIIGFPPQRFDKFHKLFSLNYRLTRLAPWLPALFFRRTLSPLQYFKIWSPLKVIYHKKRYRIYHRFTKQQYNSYAQIKLQPFRRGGGNRNFETNRVLAKVVLPFFYKTFKGINHLFNTVRSKKSKQIGRFPAFTKLFDSQLYRLIYRLNITPNVVWAKAVVKTGWVYASFPSITNNTKFLINKLSFDKLFPLLKINDKYKDRTEKSHRFLNIPITVPENKIDTHAVVNINSDMRLIIKQFFTRRLKWNRRTWPNFADSIRQKNTMVIMKKNYNDKFAKFTKDRSNIKKLPFLHN